MAPARPAASDDRSHPGSFHVPETRFPALKPLLAGGLWQRWAAEGRVFALPAVLPAVRHVRLKPRSSCRLVVFAGGAPDAPEPPPGFLLNLYADPDRARAAWDKECTRRHLLLDPRYEPFLCERSLVIAVPFPNDPRIPGLRHLFRPHRRRVALEEILREYAGRGWRIRRSLSTLGLIAYKPGRRAVFRIDARLQRLDGDEVSSVPLHVKIENLEDCRRSFAALSAVHAAVSPDAPWRVPRPRGLVESRALAAAEWVDGAPLRKLLAEPGAARLFRRVGRGLAGLHALDLALEPAPASVDRAAELRTVADDLAHLLPSLETRIRRAADRLATLTASAPPAPAVTAHGDFHLDQVLVADGKPVIVDLDRCGRGSAVADLGDFAGQLAELGADPAIAAGFVGGYEEAAGAGVDRRSLELAAAAAQFRRAVVPFRRLLPDWPEQVRRRLEQAETGIAALS